MNLQIPAQKQGGLLLLAAVLAMGVRADAGTEVIGMEIHGVLTTQVATTPTPKVKVTPVSNATIIDALIASGGAPGIPKKSREVAYAEGLSNTLEVINTVSNNEVVATLRTPNFPSTESFTDAQSKPGAADKFRLANPDFEFTLPGVSGTQITMATESFVITGGTHIKTLAISFFGGQGSGKNGSTEFIGTAHSTGKYFGH